MSRSRRARLSARSIVALLLAVLAIAALPASVAAHAELVSSTPAPNESLAEAPEQVTITFSEPIDADAAFIDLLDPEQRRVSGLGAPEVTADGREATVTLPQLERGSTRSPTRSSRRSTGTPPRVASPSSSIPAERPSRPPPR